MTLMTTSLLTPSAVTTYLFLCMLGAGGMLIVAADLWRSRTTSAGRLALAVVGCALGWLIAVICSLLSPNAALALFWHETVRFVFVVLLPPLIILYLACYFGVPRLSRPLVVGVGLIPGLTILLDLTNGLHRWFLVAYTMQRVGPYYVRASWVPGPWFPIYAIFISGSLLAVVVALALAYERRQALYRAQMGMVVLALLLPTAFILFDTLSRSPLALLGLAPLGFASTAIVLAWGLRHLRLLDLAPAAREAIFAGMTDPVLVLDMRGRIIDLNPAAEQVLDRSAETVLGAEINALLPSLSCRLADLQARISLTATGEAGSISNLTTLDLDLGHDGERQARHFDVRCSSFGLRAGRLDGHLLVLRDVTALKQAEACLAQQASQLEAIVEAMADGMVVHDPQGALLRMNQAHRQLIGLEANQDVLAHPLSEWVQQLMASDEHGRPIPTEDSASQRVLRGEVLKGPSVADVLVHTLDGRELWVSTTGAPIRAPDGRITGAVLITRDVTARRQLEQQVRELVRELETILDASPDVIAVCDHSGRIVRCNRTLRESVSATDFATFATLSPQARAELLHVRDVQGHPFAVEDLPDARALRGEVLVDQTTLDVHVRGPDGREVAANVAAAPVYDAEGRVIRAVTVWRDVTKRYQLEREIAEQAAQLEAIFEAQADGVAVFDLQGRFVRANLALRQLLGFEAESAYTSLPLDERAQHLLFFDEQGQLLSPEQWPHWRALRGEILTDASAMEGRVRTVDGRELWISTTGAPIRGSDGQITGSVLITRDVTARRALERQAAEQAAEQAAAAERTRLAHELHDTVTQEMYSAALLADSISRNWQGHRAEAELALAQLPGVIRGALAGLRVLLFELRPAALDHLPLSALLRQLGEAMSLRADVPIAVRLQLTGSTGAGSKGVCDGMEPTEPPLPPAVKVVFYRVAQEALMNAAKYARAQAIHVKMQARGAGAQSTIRLEIIDDGRGFDPHAVAAGHFGLAIMRERAHAVGATMQIRSQPGQGTQIIAAWPTEHAERERKRKRGQQAAPRRRTPVARSTA